jgi:protoporphyrinogen oxidase
MKIGILGGGISSISLAFFLQNRKLIKQISIIEKEKKLGGLLRSFKKKNIYYDVGPHIIFSKHAETLNLMQKVLKDNKSLLKRSNKIIYKSRYIKYPFENELNRLPKNDLNYCLQTFLNNPYEKLEYSNMYQFFLKNFGEGITSIYLNPYNKKIWKYDPAFMDTQMVDRIPKPPKSDIIKSAHGKKTEGYKHQLFFHYPKSGGIETLFNEFKNKLNKKNNFYLNTKILKITKKNKKFYIKTNKKVFIFDKLYSTIPLGELVGLYSFKNNEVNVASSDLKYNSIKIFLINVKKNVAGKNFAFMIPDKDIIFHRISKLDFLGKNYSIKDTTSFLVEITYRNGDLISRLSKKQILHKIYLGLKKLKFLNKKSDINFYDYKKFKYAYVIYDKNHRKNVDTIKNFFKKEKIDVAGRGGSWEYLNSDQVIYQASMIAKKFKKN